MAMILRGKWAISIYDLWRFSRSEDRLERSPSLSLEYLPHSSKNLYEHKNIDYRCDGYPGRAAVEQYLPQLSEEPGARQSEGSLAIAQEITHLQTAWPFCHNAPLQY
jgi:hypothetical protein